MCVCVCPFLSLSVCLCVVVCAWECAYVNTCTSLIRGALEGCRSLEKKTKRQWSERGCIFSGQWGDVGYLIRCWTYDRQIVVSIPWRDNASCSSAKHHISRCSGPLRFPQRVTLRRTGAPSRCPVQLLCPGAPPRCPSIYYTTKSDKPVLTSQYDWIS